MLRAQDDPRLAVRVCAALSALVLLGSLGLALATSGCAHATDPLVVDTERILIVSPTVYDELMLWADRNDAILTPAAKATFSRIRGAFPPAYRSLDSALQVYKAGRSGDLLAARDELDRMLVEANALVIAFGGPDLIGGKQ